MATNIESALRELDELEQSSTLSILALAQSIAENDAPINPKRSSDVSADGLNASITPSSLEAELAHQKEHFAKLRLSYIEQITKEKFLAAITSDPPLLVEPSENQLLEEIVAADKKSLKAQKEDVARLLVELRAQANELVRRHERLQDSMAQLTFLPSQISSLGENIDTLRAAQPEAPRHPDFALPLDTTVALVAAREAELATLNAQLASLEADCVHNTRERQRLETELQPLETKKVVTMKAAKEARRRKDEGGVDETEEMGRWLRASERVLGTLVEIG